MNLRFVPGSKTDLTWDRVDEAESYGLYRGVIRPGRDFWRENFCFATEIEGELGRDPEVPEPGVAFYYRVGWMKRDPDTGDLTWSGESPEDGYSFPRLSCGERLYVDPWAPSGGDGKSWDHAYRTIDEALHHPHTTGRSPEIWLRNRGQDAGSIEITPQGAYLRGGFAGTEDYPWDRAPSNENSTTRSGIGQNESNPGNVVRVERVDLGGGISFDIDYDVGMKATVYAHDSTLRGIYLSGTSSAAAFVHVERCEMHGSVSTSGEGWKVELDVLDSRFSGRGIHVGFNSDMTQVETVMDIRRNVFDGGFVAIDLNDTCLGYYGQDYHGVIADNVIRGYDTGIYLSCCAIAFGDSPSQVECEVDVAITNNTIVENVDGIVCNGVATASDPRVVIAKCVPRVWNNILAFNTRYGFKESVETHNHDPEQGSVEDTWTDPAEFVTNDLFGNGCMYLDDGTCELNSTSEVNALEGAADNLNVEPRFVDRSNGDFHLLPNSPLVDRGSIDAPGAGLLDMDGELRVMDGDHDGYAWPDVGADEVP